MDALLNAEWLAPPSPVPDGRAAAADADEVGLLEADADEVAFSEDRADEVALSEADADQAAAEGADEAALAAAEDADEAVSIAAPGEVPDPAEPLESPVSPASDDAGPIQIPLHGEARPPVRKSPGPPPAGDPIISTNGEKWATLKIWPILCHLM